MRKFLGIPGAGNGRDLWEQWNPWLGQWGHSMHRYVGGRVKIGINTPKCPSSRLLPSLFFPPFPVLFSLLFLFSPISNSFPPSFFTVPIPLSSFPLSLFPLPIFPLSPFPLSLPHLFPVFQGWAPAEPQSGPAPPMMDPDFHPFVFRVQTGGNWENWGLYTASRSQTAPSLGKLGFYGILLFSKDK